MTFLLLAACYALFGIGLYRTNLRRWKPEATSRMRWKARWHVGWRAAVWPYVIAYNLRDG